MSLFKSPSGQPQPQQHLGSWLQSGDSQPIEARKDLLLAKEALTVTEIPF